MKSASDKRQEIREAADSKHPIVRFASVRLGFFFWLGKIWLVLLFADSFESTMLKSNCFFVFLILFISEFSQVRTLDNGLAAKPPMVNIDN